MTTGVAFERVRDALAATGAKFADTRQSHFMATCPAHPDGRPSLGVDAKDGKVLLHCYADCANDDIVTALGLELSDLFDEALDADSTKAVRVRSYVYNGTNGTPRFIIDRLYPKSFRCRRPDTQPGDYSGIKGIEPILFHADKVWQCMRAGGCTVWLVDGEKDVETAEKHGLTATTPPGFGKKWRNSYTQFLRHADQVVIVADQDPVKDDGTPGKGQAYAIEARAALRACGTKVRVVAPAVGKDLTDHFEGGYGVTDFVAEPTASTRPRGLNASDLMQKEFEPVVFAVDGILPSGLTIFAGSPKAGKSWVGLDMCLAVASGGPALSHLETDQGCAIYLAREDTYRRLQSRISLIMGGDLGAIPKSLELVPQEHDWPGGEEGLANLTEWAEECGTPRLVVIDTLAKLEPEMGEDGGRRGAYTGNYAMMARYKQWSDTYNCAVVMIHHDRKTAAGSKNEMGMAGDPFSKISGTRGLTGAADTLWFLESTRGTGEGALHITGRDVVEQSLELRKVGPLWMATHNVERV